MAKAAGGQADLGSHTHCHLGQVGNKVIERDDDLSISHSKVIMNSTQKVCSRVLNSRNMMRVARTSWILLLRYVYV